MEDSFLWMEGEATGAIKPDYFSLDSEVRFGRRPLSEGDSDSDRPSWIDPELESRFALADLAGFWTSDESSPGDLDQASDFSGIVDLSEESGDLSSITEERSDSLQKANPGGSNLGENGRARWWKGPVEILKFLVFGIKPIWSISFAAALLGLVIWKRTLSKKKMKIKRVPLNLSLEDKASQLLVRASRINDAFSVVKRVPMIRSTVPTMGVSPFPLVALR